MGKWAYCSVCGDQASRLRYSHYGAVSCFSCRAFFRRAVEKGSTYFCQKYETCEIDKISRKKCAACRFAKCKNVGMKHGPFSNVSYSTQMLLTSDGSNIQTLICIKHRTNSNIIFWKSNELEHVHILAIELEYLIFSFSKRHRTK